MPDAADRKEGEAVAVPPAEFGRYQVFATLGRGGMADVYLAVARGPMGFNKLVVLKRLRAHLAEEPGFRDMFLDEARLAARLNHPNVIQSYEVGETNGLYFIAMEYLDGQPLNRILGELRVRGQSLEPSLGVRIIADALTGLAHAHDLRDYDGTPLRIIHRDVSPHNVFVTYEGQVKLVDFGIAKAALSKSETEVGVLKGKIAYMAPEQAMGGPIDARADLFAMGIVLWELVTGRALYTGDNAANTLHRLLNEPIPAPSTVTPGVDAALEAIILRALEKDPEQRYGSARELRDALDGWLRDHGRAVRTEDVGAWLGTLFESKRARVQREIQRHMSDLARSSSRSNVMSLTSIEQIERAGGNPNAQLANLSGENSGAGVISAVGARGTTETGVPATSQRKKRAAIAIAVALLLVAVVGLILLLRRGGEREPAPIAAVSAPAPQVSAAPLPPAPSLSAAAAAPTEAPTALASAVPSAAVATPSAPSRPAPHGRPAPAGRPSAPPAPPPTPSVDTGPPGFLTLDTYPWSKVSEGGRLLGTTPLVHLALPAGPHALSLENPDQGLRQSYTVVIKSGETVTRRLGLQ